MSFIDEGREEMRERLEKRREDFEKGQKLQRRREELIQIGESRIEEYEALAKVWERREKAYQEVVAKHSDREASMGDVLKAIEDKNSIERKMRAVKRMQG